MTLNGAVELRHAPRRIAAFVAFATLVAVAASILAVAFLQRPLYQAELRFGLMPLIAAWIIALMIVALATWWQKKAFFLRADALGIVHVSGGIRRHTRWTDIAAAEARAPAVAGGTEYVEGLTVVLFDSRGRSLLTLAQDLGGGLPTEQVAAFKQYVRARLEQHNILKKGPTLTWINWG